MRQSISLALAGLLVVAAGCDEKKSDDTAKTAEGAAGGEAAKGGDAKGGDATGDKAGEATQTGEAATIAEEVGVEPGPWEYDKAEGSAAVLAIANGSVEIRRVGSETWDKGEAATELHEGDQLRTGDASTASIVMSDESAIEVAEDSAVAIGSSQATEDPASSASVMYGVARFTVAERAEGEGPFMVYTQAGVVATKGTVYTVGVIASGETRVGVETGEVEVAGAAKLDAPVALASGKVIVLAPAGEVGAPEAAGTVDWGTWRDDSEAKVDAEAAAKFHADQAIAIEADLKATYAELEAQTQAAAEAEAKAQAAADAADEAAYQAAAPEVGGAVDASFALSLKLHFLSNALLGHVYVVDALYIRNPKVVVLIDPIRPKLAASILWHKKFYAVAHTELVPLRPLYYTHHPVGRVRARFVGFTVAPFFAKVKLAYKVPDVRGRVKVVVYRPPVVRAHVGLKKAIWIGAPRVGWYVGMKGRVRPAPFKVAWYVRPKAPKATVVFGARATGQVPTVFAVVAPRPRAEAVVRFKGGFGVRERAGAGAGAGAGVKGAVVVPGARAGVKVKGSVGGALKGAAVEVHEAGEATDAALKAAAGSVKAAGAAVKAGADVRVQGGATVKAGAGGAVKVKKAEPPPVTAPKAKGDVKGSIKVKGGIKLGN